MGVFRFYPVQRGGQQICFWHMLISLLTYAGKRRIIVDRQREGEKAMPRPRKCRKVCHFPQTLEFAPARTGGEGPPVILTVDEYEAIRLIDREGFSQEQCGVFMGVARTTVQQVYASAREKLALFLVEGRPLRIGGGDYRLCRGGEEGCSGCFKRRYHERYAKSKGEHSMRIAVTYEGGQVFQHFGHTREFKVYDVEGGEVKSAQVVDTNGSGHGALAGVLNALSADILICGGIGGGAQAALAAAGIQLYGGVSGGADEAVASFLAGKLDYDPDVRCGHHKEHHHHGGECGSHGCGEHTCGG